MTRIIPSHFENDIAADGRAFRAAFNFLETGRPELDLLEAGAVGSKGSIIPGFNFDFASLLGVGKAKADAGRSASQGNLAGATKEDLGLLDAVSDVFTTLWIVAPAEVA